MLQKFKDETVRHQEEEVASILKRMTLGLENEKPVGYVGHMGLGKTGLELLQMQEDGACSI